MATFEESFMRDVPRGDSNRHLRQQHAPQTRWMKPGAIMASSKLAYDPDNPGRKVLIGALGRRLLGLDDDRHFLTVAGSRSGKSVGLISNLFFYRGSILATDPKGELARITAARRAALGQKIIILDPFGHTPDALSGYRASYNPMSVLKADSASFLEDAAMLAESIVVQPRDQKDPHWDESAKNFIEGVIAHVAMAAQHEGRRHLITVRELIKKAHLPSSDDDDSEPVLYREMIHNADRLESDECTADIGAGIRAAAVDFYSKGDSEGASVYSTILRHTKFLDYAAFRGVMQGHDFDLSELKTNPDGVSVYLCFPATRMEISNRWLRIFVNQLLDAMERVPVAPDIPVLTCLDEFPVLGYMKQLESAAGLIASFGVKLWVILQDWSQGKALYGERWETFAGNAGFMQFFGNNDLTTTEYVSKKLGKTLVESTKSGDVTQDQEEKGHSGRSETTQLYDLLTPDEVSRLCARDDPHTRQIVLLAGKFPLLIQRVVYHDPDGPLARYL